MGYDQGQPSQSAVFQTEATRYYMNPIPIASATEDLTHLPHFHVNLGQFC